MAKGMTKRGLLDETCDGLDCIDITYYIDITKTLEDVMQEIQMDFQYDHLPSEAMYIFSQPHFHQDVFRGMGVSDFEKYLRQRYMDDDDIELIFEDSWLAEDGYDGFLDV